MNTERYSHRLYIHGFLEVPKRKGLNNFHVLNLYELAQLNDSEIKHRLSGLSNKYDEVIAYSLGGRFLLKYYEKVFFKFSKISILSAHPGNYSDQDRMEAKSFYELVCGQLDKLKDREFSLWWNQLAIFKEDDSLTSVDSGYDYKALFKRWPSYEQKDYSTFLKQDNIKYLICGEHDEKYKSIYQAINLPFKTKVIPNTGHRTNTDEVINSIVKGDYD